MKNLFKKFDETTSPANLQKETEKSAPANLPTSLSSQSSAISLYGLVTALWGVEQEVGVGSWKTTSEQQYFIELLNKYRNRIPSWGEVPGFEAKSTNDVTEMNDFLASKGFNIALQDAGALAFYVAALSEFVKEWEKQGDMTLFTVNSNEDKFLASKFKCSDFNRHLAKAITMPNGDIGIIKYLKMESKEDLNLAVVIAPATRGSYTAKQLLEEAAVHVEQVANPNVADDVVTCTVPYTTLHKQTDLNFLKGMTYGDANIQEAKFEMKAVIDRNGYASKTATAIAATRGMSMGGDVFIPNPVVTLVNIGQPDARILEPIEVMHVGTDSWVQYGVNDELFNQDEQYSWVNRRVNNFEI